MAIGTARAGPHSRGEGERRMVSEIDGAQRRRVIPVSDVDRRHAAAPALGVELGESFGRFGSRRGRSIVAYDESLKARRERATREEGVPMAARGIVDVCGGREELSGERETPETLQGGIHKGIQRRSSPIREWSNGGGAVVRERLEQ
ncbi:hypothetical protein E2562_024731 [Oryza meyeriana var. granulata]|uniref:Uncharacterized protein n=1 Tax=Oryza meyeriana var. granulata TaxID=110450 RepID=A0A6G1D7C7_9ORYZ|nr:hypothetical protein E2562_024731 [Oryza meyeriana var. granulata]